MINHARGHAKDGKTIIGCRAEDRRYPPGFGVASADHQHVNAFIRKAGCRLGQISRRGDGGDFDRQAERFSKLSDPTHAIYALRLRWIDYRADGLNIGHLDLGQGHILLVWNRHVRAGDMRHFDAGRIGDAGGIRRADDGEEQNRRVVHLFGDIGGYLGDGR